jgi:hypothetical protein
VARTGHVVTELLLFALLDYLPVLLLSELGNLVKRFAAGAFVGCAGRVAEDALGSGDGALGVGVASVGMGTA